MVSIGFFLVSALAVGSVIAIQGWSGEPFLLFDGVSIWPTEILRLVAAAIAIYLIGRGWTNVYRCASNIATERLNLNGLSPPKKWPEPKAEPLDKAWREYVAEHVPNRHVGKVICCGTTLYLAACYSLILAFGKPIIPGRGASSYYVDHVVLVVSILALAVLVVFTGHATRSLNGLIRKLDYIYQKGLMPIPLHYRKELPGCPDDIARAWTIVDLIARQSEVVAHLVYYPIIVIFVLCVARLPYFDRWDLPLGLTIVIGGSVIYLIWRSFRISYFAGILRQHVLTDLRNKHLLAEAAKNSTAAPKLIELMIDRITNLRYGAYVHPLNQPWLRALGLVFSGGGTLALLERYILGI